jgi:mannose-6-phosphate isomerase-like protein (cupin superfamily)
MRFVLPVAVLITCGLIATLTAMSHESAPSAAPALEVIPLEKQPWYEAEDRARAREMASPRNSRARQLSIADIIIPAGVAVKPHYHKVIEEVYHITAGSGVMVIDGREALVGPGDTVVILPGERHSVRADVGADLRMIVTCTPPWTPDCLIFD